MRFQSLFNFAGRCINSKQIGRRTLFAAGAGLTTVAGIMFQTAFANEQQDSLVYSWGYGGFGQLGLQNENNYYEPQEIEVLADKKVVSVQAGKSISMALTTNGEVYSWGKNKGGILGHDDRSSFNKTQPEKIEKLLGVKVASVSCGQFHMAALTQEGQIYTWGNKEFGKLGHQEEADDGKFTFKRGNVAYDYLQDSRAPEKIVINGGQKCKQVSCGGQFTAVLTEDGYVYTFGQNAKGALGFMNESKGVTKPQKVEGLENIVKIQTGHDFCAAVTANGKLYTWGNNSNGQLGNNQNIYQTKPTIVTGFGSQTKIVDVSCGVNFVAALTSEGKLFTWGYGSDGQLGHGNKSDLYAPSHLEFKDKIKKVSCGGTHTAFITQQGKLYVFGRGSEGQLGIGQNIESEASFRTSPKLVKFFDKLQVVDVTCGGEHTIAVAQPEIQKK